MSSSSFAIATIGCCRCCFSIFLGVALWLGYTTEKSALERKLQFMHVFPLKNLPLHIFFSVHFFHVVVFISYELRTDFYFHFNGADICKYILYMYSCWAEDWSLKSEVQIQTQKSKPIFTCRRSADKKLPNNFNFHGTSIIIKFCIIWSNPRSTRNDEIDEEYTTSRNKLYSI